MRYRPWPLAPGIWHLVPVFLMKVKCPICHKKVEWEGNPFRPFCSERCKLKDLGSWASEEYKVKGEKAGEDEEKKPTLH